MCGRKGFQLQEEGRPGPSPLHGPSWQGVETFLKEPGPELTWAGEREHRAEAPADTRHSEVGGDRTDKACRLGADNGRQRVMSPKSSLF